MLKKIHGIEVDSVHLHQAEMTLNFWDGGPREAATRHLALTIAEERARGWFDGAKFAARAIFFVNLLWVAAAILWSH